MGDSIGPVARIEACTQAIDGGDLDENDLAATFFSRGMAHDQRGEYVKAITDFDRTLRLDPADIDARMARAEAYVAVGSFEGARRDYRRVLMQAPDHTDARQGCVDVLVALELDDQIDQALDHQCAIVTIDALAYAQATHATGSELLDVSETEAAIQDLVWEIEAWRSRRDYDEAARAYSLARRLDADLLACLYTNYDAPLLDAYDRSVRPDVYADEAARPTLDELNVILDSDPLDPIALRERGLLYMQVSGFKQAIEDFDLALENDPYPEQARAIRGLAWWIYYRYVLALDDLDQAMSMGEDNVVLHLARGLALEQLRRFDEAVHELDFVIADLPNETSDADVLWMKSLAYSVRSSAKLKMGDPDGDWEQDFDRYWDLSGEYVRLVKAHCVAD